MRKNRLDSPKLRASGQFGGFFCIESEAYELEAFNSSSELGSFGFQ